MKRPIFPAVHHDPAELLREAKVIKRWVLAHGVDSADADDVVAETILIAWKKVEAKRYRPAPTIPPRIALIAWLRGVTWRNVSNFRAVSRHRSKVMAAVRNMSSVALDLETALLARDELILLLRSMKPKRRDVLIAFAMGCGAPEIAEALGICEATVWTRLRQARIDLLAILRRASVRGR